MNDHDCSECLWCPQDECKCEDSPYYETDVNARGVCPQSACDHFEARQKKYKIKIAECCATCENGMDQHGLIYCRDLNGRNPLSPCSSLYFTWRARSYLAAALSVEEE